MPVQIPSSQMFATGNPVVTGDTGNPLVTPTGSSLTIGTTSTGTDQSLLYGCLWYPTMVPFGNGLRAYFEYTVIQAGEGFTFGLADVEPVRNPSVIMCGAGADALGYAGSNGATAPINYPKIALEFDLKYTAARNDPASPPAMHFAFDYWGVGSDINDDDTHGAGDDVTDPKNPAVCPPPPLPPRPPGCGLRQPSTSIPNGTKVFVRLDIQRTYNSIAKQGNYNLQAYVVSGTLTGTSLGFPPLSSSASGVLVTCSGSNFSDLTTDIATSTSCLFLNSNSLSSNLTYLSDSITINDVAGEALRRIYLGFTAGQTVAAPESITVQNFTAVTY
jgi:hypothetical protein